METRGARWHINLWLVGNDPAVASVQTAWAKWCEQMAASAQACTSPHKGLTETPALSIEMGSAGQSRAGFSAYVVADGADREWGETALAQFLEKHRHGLAGDDPVLMLLMAVADGGVEADGQKCYLDPEPQQHGWIVWGWPRSEEPGRLSLCNLSHSDVLRSIVASYNKIDADADVSDPRSMAAIGQALFTRAQTKHARVAAE